jgi:N-acylglucosamine-6-phosphate 2-epimerase
MADCSEAADAAAAVESGAEIVATTLAGYTAATRGLSLPALELVAALVARHPFVVCEGGIASPHQARAAFEAGASAIVVGTAITNVDVLVRGFAAAVPRAFR